jgi:hypothetical protein
MVPLPRTKNLHAVKHTISTRAQAANLACARCSHFGTADRGERGRSCRSCYAERSAGQFRCLLTGREADILRPVLEVPPRRGVRPKSDFSPCWGQPHGFPKTMKLQCVFKTRPLEDK